MTLLPGPGSASALYGAVLAIVAMTPASTGSDHDRALRHGARHHRAHHHHRAHKPRPHGRRHHRDATRTLASGSSTPFAATSVWNTAANGSATVDPGSAAMVARLNREIAGEQASGRGPWLNTTSYSTPVYTVPASQPLTSVTLDHQPDAALSSAFAGVPLPADARPAAGSDGHLVVTQPSTDRMWEFWRLSRQADGWHTRWGGAMEHVSTNNGVFGPGAWPGAKPWWGATATSLPLLGGLIRVSELQAGHIDHALAISLPQTRSGTWAEPATRGDGTVPGADAIPEGARLRIDPGVDIRSLRLPPITRMLAEAAQRYGIVVRDRATVATFVAEDPAPVGGTNPYTNNPTGSAPKPGGFYGGLYPTEFLAAFPWSRLQVLPLRLHTL